MPFIGEIEQLRDFQLREVRNILGTEKGYRVYQLVEIEFEFNVAHRESVAPLLDISRRRTKPLGTWRVFSLFSSRYLIIATLDCDAAHLPAVSCYLDNTQHIGVDSSIAPNI